MTLDKDDLIAALRLRYDHYSAQAVLEAACARAGLADKTAYDAPEVATLRAALAQVGDRLDHVNARLDALLDRAPASAREPKDAAVKDTKPSKGKADARPERKADAPPAAKAEATADAYANAPSETKDDATADPKADATAEIKPDATADAKSQTKPETKADAKAEAKADAKPETHADAKPAVGAGIATTIALAGVDAGEDEQILICGGFAELGDWDPAKARPMAREGEHWLTTVEVPRGADITFKFLRRRADGTVVWEGGDDRTLAPAPRVDATWRSSAS